MNPFSLGIKFETWYIVGNMEYGIWVKNNDFLDVEQAPRKLLSAIPKHAPVSEALYMHCQFHRRIREK